MLRRYALDSMVHKSPRHGSDLRVKFVSISLAADHQSSRSKCLDASNIKHSLAMTKSALHSMATIYIL